MSKTENKSDGVAIEILNHPLVEEILTELEQTALEVGVQADPEDDATRRNAAMEVRTVRKFRDALQTRASGNVRTPNTKAVA